MEAIKKAWVGDNQPVVGKAGRIRINVSGQLFVTTRETLARFPHTKLGQLLQDGNEKNSNDYFFDSDEVVFREVLRYHRTSELHVPKDMCHETFVKQLEYWGVAEEEIQQCCLHEEKALSELEKQLEWFDKRLEPEGALTWGHHVWYFLTDPTGPFTKHKKAAMIWTIIYSLLISVQVVNIALITMPTFRAQLSTKNSSAPSATSGKEMWELAFANPCLIVRNLMIVSIDTADGLSPFFVHVIFSWIFLAENFTRMFACPCKKTFFRSSHCLEFTAGIIDASYSNAMIIMSFTQFYPATDKVCSVLSMFSLFVVIATTLKMIRLLMLLSVFRQMRVLLLALYNSRKEILLLFVVLFISSLLCGTLIYYAETVGIALQNNANPNIASLPTGYWWSLVTMTTVGYGDYYPTTFTGYIAACITMVLGLMVTSLPIAVIGANFSIIYDELLKKERRELAQKSAVQEKDLEEKLVLEDVDD